MKKLLLFFLGTLVIETQCMNKFKPQLKSTLIASLRTLKYPPFQPFHNKFMHNVKQPAKPFPKIARKSYVFASCPYGFVHSCAIAPCNACDVDGIPPENN